MPIDVRQGSDTAYPLWDVTKHTPKENGELCGVFEWWMKMGGILVAILVNWVWYLSGPPQQVRFWAEYG